MRPEPAHADCPRENEAFPGFSGVLTQYDTLVVININITLPYCKVRAEVASKQAIVQVHTNRPQPGRTTTQAIPEQCQSKPASTAGLGAYKSRGGGEVWGGGAPPAGPAGRTINQSPWGWPFHQWNETTPLKTKGTHCGQRRLPVARDARVWFGAGPARPKTGIWKNPPTDPKHLHARACTCKHAHMHACMRAGTWFWARVRAGVGRHAQASLSCSSS